MPLGPFAAATDASPGIRHAATLLKTGALALIAVVLSLFTPSPAHAAQFTVTNLTDSGTGSLRQAIINANAAAGADTITFSVSGTIYLGSQLPDLTVGAGALTMDGAGQTVTISGNNAVRVMQVVVGTSLTLNNLTIANGIATGDYGGGIYNSGTLTVTNSTFSGNSATGGFGGAINNNTGTLTITNSTAYAWTDPSLGPNGWLIRAQHIIDLRTALGEAYVQAARTPPTYVTDPPPSLAPGVVVKAAHIAEIRTALLAIE